MESRLITISDSGAVSVPSRVSMRDFEIANLLGVTYSTVRGKIKTLLKSGRFESFGSGGTVMLNGSILPDYFGLDMVVAIAFSVDSYESDIFRRYILSRASKPTSQTVFISLNNQCRDIIYN